jgi:hypothetical protein
MLKIEIAKDWAQNSKDWGNNKHGTAVIQGT